MQIVLVLMYGSLCVNPQYEYATYINRSLKNFNEENECLCSRDCGVAEPIFERRFEDLKDYCCISIINFIYLLRCWTTNIWAWLWGILTGFREVSPRFHEVSPRFHRGFARFHRGFTRSPSCVKSLKFLVFALF